MSARLKEILGTEDEKAIESHKKAILDSYDAGGLISEQDFVGRIPYIALIKKGIIGQSSRNAPGVLSYPLTENGVKLVMDLDTERSKKTGPVVM